MHSLLLALTTAIAIFYNLPALQLLSLLKQGSACFKHCSKACLMRSAPQPFYTTDVWELHWFPLKQRIHFKILLFAFKAIHGVAPTYIQNLVSLKSQGTYNLSSAGGILLASSTFRSKVALSDRSFQVAAPKLWNALPRELRGIANLHPFKSNLKTYVFKFAYGWMNFNCYISIF